MIAGAKELNPFKMDLERNRIWSSVDRPEQKLAWRGERMEEE